MHDLLLISPLSHFLISESNAEQYTTQIESSVIGILILHALSMALSILEGGFLLITQWQTLYVTLANTVKRLRTHTYTANGRKLISRVASVYKSLCLS